MFKVQPKNPRTELTLFFFYFHNLFLPFIKCRNVSWVLRGYYRSWIDFSCFSLHKEAQWQGFRY